MQIQARRKRAGVSRHLAPRCGFLLPALFQESRVSLRIVAI